MMKQWRVSKILLLSLVFVTSGCTINYYTAAVPDAHQKKVASETNAKITPSNQARSRSPINLIAVSGSGNSSVVYEDEVITLTIKSEVNAFVNCYYQLSNGQIVKLFPNRYMPEYWVSAGQQIDIPASAQFQIVADRQGQSERFMCLASSEDILVRLPPVFSANLFQKVPVKSFDDMYDIYRRRTSQNLVGNVVSLNVQR